jgi:hypothetical protein
MHPMLSQELASQRQQESLAAAARERMVGRARRPRWGLRARIGTWLVCLGWRLIDRDVPGSQPA